MEPPQFESEGRRAKRGRDEEEPFQEEDCCSNDLKQRRTLSDLLSKDDDDAVFTAENLDYDQELISDVMKSLADEITGSNPAITTSEPPPSVYDSASTIPDENSNNAASNVDLEYLLGATDDELGIPPSPNCLAENEVVNGVAAFENPGEDLFETPRPESQSQAEGLLQFCDSDSWYLPYEYEAAMLNESLCQDWQARSLQGDGIGDCHGSLPMDKTRMQLLESGVGM